MGLELRQVVQTIMSDLGMGEDQSKIEFGFQNINKTRTGTSYVAYDIPCH